MKLWVERLSRCERPHDVQHRCLGGSEALATTSPLSPLDLSLNNRLAGTQVSD